MVSVTGNISALYNSTTDTATIIDKKNVTFINVPDCHEDDRYQGILVCSPIKHPDGAVQEPTYILLSVLYMLIRLSEGGGRAPKVPDHNWVEPVPHCSLFTKVVRRQYPLFGPNTPFFQVHRIDSFGNY